MKRFAKPLAMFVISTSIVLALVGHAMALEFMLSATVNQTVTKLDKNGNEYVRLIVTQDRALDGVKYSTSLPVMCFGSSVEDAKTLKVGDSFKAITQSNVYNGRESFRMIKLVK